MRYLSHTSMTRRGFMGGLAAATAGEVVSRPLIAAPATALLRLATYGGVWRDAMHQYVEPLLTAQGFEVEYTLDNPSGFVTRLVAARGRTTPFDVMESGSEFFDPLKRANLIQKIDLERIPSAAKLPAFAKDDYFVAPLATVQGIVYNADKFKEVGLQPPESFADLANPKLAGRVAFPEITQGSSHYAAVVGLAYAAGGDESTLEKALPLLNQINPAYFYASSSELSTKFGSGETWAAPWHNGYAVRLRQAGLPIQFAYPYYGDKRGAIILGMVHITQGSQNVPGAEAFASAYLDQKAQFGLANSAGMLPLNSDARDMLKGRPEGEGLPLTDAAMDDCRMIDYSKINVQRWRDAWQRGVKR